MRKPQKWQRPFKASSPALAHRRRTVLAVVGTALLTVAAAAGVLIYEWLDELLEEDTHKAAYEQRDCHVHR